MLLRKRNCLFISTRNLLNEHFVVIIRWSYSSLSRSTLCFIDTFQWDPQQCYGASNYYSSRIYILTEWISILKLLFHPPIHSVSHTTYLACVTCQEYFSCAIKTFAQTNLQYITWQKNFSIEWLRWRLSASVGVFVHSTFAIVLSKDSMGIPVCVFLCI